MSYIELHARSAFSFLEGASLPEELAGVCAHLGMSAMALLDTDGVYGAPRFHSDLSFTPALLSAFSKARPCPRSWLECALISACPPWRCSTPTVCTARHAFTWLQIKSASRRTWERK